MSKEAYGVTMPALETALAAAEEHQALLPDLAFERRALRATIDKIKKLKGRQESHAAARQQATQDMHRAIEEARRLVEAIRDSAKSKIGRRSELLTHFGVTPQRKRSKVKQEAEAPTPEAG
jgi:hypothetical protein